MINAINMVLYFERDFWFIVVTGVSSGVIVLVLPKFDGKFTHQL